MKHLRIVLVTLSLSTAAHAKLIKICFEAESAALVVPSLKTITPAAKGPFSGAGFIDIAPKAPKAVGSATYKLNVTAPGSYYVYARTFYSMPGNSILLLINGSPRVLGEDGNYFKWHWITNDTPVRLKAGANTVVLTNRETGVKIDQIFFTNDPAYTPTKMPHVTHDGGTGKPVAAPRITQAAR